MATKKQGGKGETRTQSLVRAGSHDEHFHTLPRRKRTLGAREQLETCAGSNEQENAERKT